jgi:hypothetical protein
MTRPPARRRAREDDGQLHLELGEAVAAVAGVRLVRDGVRDLAQVGDIEQHDCPRAGGREPPFSVVERGLVTFYNSKQWTKQAAARGAGSRRSVL